MATTKQDTNSGKTSSGRQGWAVALAPLVAWYDFLIFPVVALSYFGPLFFAHESDARASSILIGLWLVGYALRPVGAMIFGTWGDSGRRTHALAAAVALSALATGAIGLLPVAGGWAIPALVICRCLAGVGLGGAWSGAMVLAAERGGPTSSGQGALAQIGLPLAMLATFGAIALFILSPSGFTETWGWRLPFVGSFVFVLVALFIAFAVPDRPTIERPDFCARTEVARHPVAVGLLFGVVSAFFASGLTFFHGLFVLHYGQSDWMVPVLLYLGGAAIAAGGALVGVGIGAFMLRLAPAWGVVLVGSLAASGTFVFVLILLAFVSVNWACLLVAMSIGMLGIAYGALPTLLADAFVPAKRYTGVALVSSLSGLIGAAVPIAIYYLAGSAATYAFALLTFVLLVVAGMAAFGATVLNMAYPRSSKDVPSVSDQVAKL